VRLLTHILYETMDDLENFRCSRPGLILGEPIQPLEDCLGILVSSKKPFDEFL